MEDVQGLSVAGSAASLRALRRATHCGAQCGGRAWPDTLRRRTVHTASRMYGAHTDPVGLEAVARAGPHATGDGGVGRHSERHRHLSRFLQNLCCRN